MSAGSFSQRAGCALEQLLAVMFDGGSRGPRTQPRTSLLVEDMRLEWRELDRRIAALTAEFVARAREDHAARRLATIPGFGALNATALVAAIGKGADLPSGARPCRMARARAAPGHNRRQAKAARHQQARQHIPAHAADPRSAGGAAFVAGERNTPLGDWLRGLIGRAHKNKVVVALAGKLARIAWAVLRSGESYTVRAAERPVMA